MAANIQTCSLLMPCWAADHVGRIVIRRGLVHACWRSIFTVTEELSDLSSRVADFLASLTTITLATVDQHGEPFAAAVYFAHDEHLNLFFLSAQSTAHGANLLAHSQVAGTAYEEHQEWKSLRGLQLRGVAGPVEFLEFPHAAAVYTKKHPFVSLATRGSPAELLKAMASATLWKLTPTWMEGNFFPLEFKK